MMLGLAAMLKVQFNVIVTLSVQCLYGQEHHIIKLLKINSS